MVKTDPTLLEFEEFARRVELPAIHVRTALRALRKTPVSLLEDARQKRYRAEWVDEVRKWIVDNLGAR